MVESFSLKFFPYKSPDSEPREKAKLYVRITVNRLKAEVCLGDPIDALYWDELSERSTNDKKLNEHIVFVESRLYEIKRSLEYARKTISAKLIKDIYTGKDRIRRSLMNYYGNSLNRMTNLPQEYSKLTLEHYRNTQKNLRAFLDSQNIKDILMNEIDSKWINDFDYYLLTTINKKLEKAMSRNTANKQHARLKAILKRAICDGIIERDPYVTFKFKHTKSHRDFLTDEEIRKIAEHSLGENQSLHTVRDIFLFSVYSGLRYSDAMALTKRNVILRNDKYWMEIVQEKTNEKLYVPMLEKAVAIYHKYEQLRKITGYVLPRFSNQKINVYLKTIADLVGIDKKLTHHIARHTFATSALSKGLAIEIVGKLLGHTNLKTTQIYAKITDDYFSSSIDKLDDALRPKKKGNENKEAA